MLAGIIGSLEGESQGQDPNVSIDDLRHLRHLLTVMKEAITDSIC